MSTVTIPKTKYEALKKQAAAYRRILSANHHIVPKGLARVPNKETRQAIAEIETPARRAKLKRYASAEKMFAEMLGKNWREK